MEEKKYLEDFKNIKPLPLDKIPVRSGKSFNKQLPIDNIQSKNVQHSSFNNQHSKEVSMERLTTSKTLWGFGIAVLIYIMQQILIALNITGPDNLIVKAVIEAVIAIAGFFGVYGVRDALRKMSL